MNWDKIKKVYMIGIKGVGMTMLAEYLCGQNIEILGSDTPDIYMTDGILKKAGIKVIENFSVDNIPADSDLIIYSTAYSTERNVEVAAAVGGKIKTLTYAEALGEVFNQKYGIAVVGSHGKTTTTAWLGYVLDRAGKSPSVMVGSLVPQFSGSALIGKSDYLIIEADEYQNKLRYFNPKIILLNNIDYDHPDFFPTPEDYENVFLEFIKKLPSKGILITNFDDPIIRKTAQVNCRGQVITYGINEAADYIAYDIKSISDPTVATGQKQFFSVKLGADNSDEDDLATSDHLGDFSIQLLGQHNIYNALAVIAACIELGVELVDIRKHLEKFRGTARRLQLMGEFRGAKIYDDYAHHPTEIKTTLAGLRQLYKKEKITVVFHPHTFTRTKALLDDFATSFNDADELIVLDIYGSAREKQGGVSSEELVEKIKKQNSEGRINNIKHIPNLVECEKYLRENISRDDIVILMGAGDIFRVGENLVKF